jgi:hypothetical protein
VIVLSGTSRKWWWTTTNGVAHRRIDLHQCISLVRRSLRSCSTLKDLTQSVLAQRSLTFGVDRLLRRVSSVRRSELGITIPSAPAK